MPDAVFPPDPALTDLDAELRRWRVAYPDATFTEIEQAIDARWRAVRAGLLAALAGTDDADAEVRFPECGGAMARRGERTRTVWTPGDEPVALIRSYAACPACGTGLFPPG